MKTFLLCITAFVAQFSSAQTPDSLDITFYQLEEIYGVFEVTSKNGDTSFIVGDVNISGDTIYFKEYTDTMIVKLRRMNAVNTRVMISPALRVVEDVIHSKYYYLGNKYNLMSLDTVEYVFNDSLVTTYTNRSAVGDTMHEIDFEPSEYFLLSVRNSHMQSKSHSLRSTDGRQKKKKKNYQPEFATYWRLKYAIYCSKNPDGLNIQELVGDSWKMGHHVYTMVWE